MRDDAAISSKRGEGAAEAPPYPLTAIVGHQDLKRGLLLAVANPRIGTVLISGERDTGKRTAAHGLAPLLPFLDAMEECPVQCSPSARKKCPVCESRGGKAKPTRARMPFVEIPISATEDKLLGSMRGGAPNPGLLATANGGIAFMERANLFSEGTLGLVLDVRNAGKIERNGAWPAQFTLVATMNEEEGELAKELLGRFSMAIHVSSLGDIEERLEILRRVEAYKGGPREFAGHYAREEAAVRERLVAARKMLDRADVPKKVTGVIEKVCKKVGADGESALRNLREAALASAILDGRSWATVEDVAEVADFVLKHQL